MKIIISFLVLFLALSVHGARTQTITTGPLRTANADTTTPVCAAATLVKSIIISCLSTNTEVCLIGDSNVDHATLRGTEIAVGGTYAPTGDIVDRTGALIDCNTINFQVGVNSEGISYTTLR